jgi:uncharacterized protein
MISRIIKTELIKSIRPGFVTSLFGARRTGKTVMMEVISNELNHKKILKVHGENLDAAEILSSQRSATLKNFLSGYDFLFIDEAQKIPNIGINLKLIVDTLPETGIFITGSSALELIHRTGEPLTGRGKNYLLFPIAQAELDEDFLKRKENLEDRLVFGYYPQVVTADTDKERISVLESIKNGYLLKDILELDNNKNSLFILNLLRLLAYQIGNDISLSELASSLQVNRNTVIRYLDLLEKCYVIFSHHGFSRNLRKEFTKSPRFYFWDNGIRNSVILNYNRLNVRDDIGKLWENYCIAERRKMNNYKERMVNSFFWRTYDQKEIDLIEESGGKLSGYEFKWKDEKVRIQKDFTGTYPGSTLETISKENYIDFII